MSLTGAAKSVPLIAAFVLALSPYWWANGYQLSVATLAMEYVIMGLGLNLIFGHTGRVSFGHSGFFGVGAYTLALTQTEWDLPPLVAVVLALGATALVATAVGIPILRLRGHYLALGTLAFGFVVLSMIGKFSNITGGSDGLRVPTSNLFGLEPRNYIYIGYVVVACLTLYLMSKVASSRFGRALVAIREDEEAARSLGVQVELYVIVAFVASAVLFAAAGVLHAYSFGTLAPELVDLRLNILLLLIVIVGGLGNNYGVALAAVLLAVLPQYLIDFEERETLYYGFALLAILILVPRGLGEASRGLALRVARIVQAREAA